MVDLTSVTVKATLTITTKDGSTNSFQTLLKYYIIGKTYATLNSYDSLALLERSKIFEDAVENNHIVEVPVESSGFWYFIMGMLAIVALYVTVRLYKKKQNYDSYQILNEKLVSA